MTNVVFSPPLTFLGGHYLQNFGLNTDFLKSPFLKATKNGMLHEWEALPGKSIAERKRIPISIDMIMGVYASFDPPGSVSSRFY